MSEKSGLSPTQASLISFASGAAYGMTSVVVGQPFDVCKTRMQAMGKSAPSGLLSTAKGLFDQEGVRGLFRGGLPMMVGGALFRSAQFGCNEAALGLLGGPSKQRYVYGVIDPHVIAAGFMGDLGRGVIESPFEYVKVRRQVGEAWRLRDVYRGSGVTLTRNAFLFTFFMFNIDLSKQLVPGGLGPFLTGAVCASGAWLVIWPLDVLKSRRQSGLYDGVSSLKLMRDLVREGAMFRGLVPGLFRSIFANGASMMVYNHVQQTLVSAVSVE